MLLGWQLHFARSVRLVTWRWSPHTLSTAHVCVVRRFDQATRISTLTILMCVYWKPFNERARLRRLKSKRASQGPRCAEQKAVGSDAPVVAVVRVPRPQCPFHPTRVAEPRLPYSLTRASDTRASCLGCACQGCLHRACIPLCTPMCRHAGCWPRAPRVRSVLSMPCLCVSRTVLPVCACVCTCPLSTLPSSQLPWQSQFSAPAQEEGAGGSSGETAPGTCSCPGQGARTQ